VCVFTFALNLHGLHPLATAAAAPHRTRNLIIGWRANINKKGATHAALEIARATVCVFLFLTCCCTTRGEHFIRRWQRAAAPPTRRLTPDALHMAPFGSLSLTSGHVRPPPPPAMRIVLYDGRRAGVFLFQNPSRRCRNLGTARCKKVHRRACTERVCVWARRRQIPALIYDAD